MKKFILSALLVLTATLSSQSIFAAPYKYAKCPGVSITPPEGSAGYVMDEDCQTAYVLPPETGEVSVTSYASDLTSEQCKDTQEVFNFNRSAIASISAQNRNLSAEIAENEKLRAQAASQSNRCFSIDEKARLYGAAIIKIEGQREALVAQQQGLEAVRAKCVTDGRADCGANDYKIEKLSAAIAKADELLILRRAEQRSLVSQFESCQSAADRQSAAIVKRIEDSEARIEAIKRKLKDIVTDNNTRLASESGVAGATMSLVFTSGIPKAVQAYVEKNPRLAGKVRFVAMPLKGMQIHFTAVTNGVAAKLPVVLSSEINGLPVIKDAAAVDTSILNVEDTAQRSLVMGSALGGRVVVNRLAACNFAAQPSSNFAGLINASVSYDYDLVAKRSYTIDYIESHLYQLIKRQTSSNGFFRSSSALNISESSTAKQWIDIAFHAEDTNLNFQDTLKMAQDIREELLNSALMRVAKGALQEGNPALPPVGASGADRASGVIKKCPHYYCQVGGLVLDLGSALFGGSSSSVNVTKYARAEHGTRVRDTAPITHTGTLAFRVNGGASGGRP
jgi:hypothetical protein